MNRHGRAVAPGDARRTAPGFRRWLAALGVALAVGGSAREVPITILHTSDLHGRIVNYLPERRDDRPEAGLLRAATLIRRVRAEAANVLLVDIGDVIQGSPESTWSQADIMAEAMRLLRYDAGVPGNHEFDWGARALTRWLEMAPYPLLAANWQSRIGAPRPAVRDGTIREVDGLRVALVGLTTPGIPTWTSPDQMPDWRILHSVEALESALPRIRSERPDLMILLVHQGLRPNDPEGANELAAIADRFPDFDVILGGHTHEEIPEKQLGRALLAQAGWHGHAVGRVDLVYDTVARKLTRRTGALIRVTAEVPPDPELEKALRPTLDRAERRLKTVIGVAPARRAAFEGPWATNDVAALLRDIVRDATGAEAVFHGALSRIPLAAGPVTERDLWAIMPYENRIGVLQLTVSEFSAVLEEALALDNRRYTWGLSGLRVETDPDAPAGRRIRSIRGPDGRPLHPRCRVKIAFNSYDLASAGGRLPTLRALTRNPETRFQPTETDTREVVRAWMKKHWSSAPATTP